MASSADQEILKQAESPRVELLHRLNPAVAKKWLVVVAGMMWTGVGLMLTRLAYGWLTAAPSPVMLMLGVLGICFSLVLYRFGFLKVAQDNIARIWDSPDRACLFSFQAWRGYLIIAVMIPLGLLLRNSPVPKPYLAVLYTAIGGGLFLASFHYYAFFYRVAWRGQAMSEE